MEEQGSVGRERRLVERDPGLGFWRCGVQEGRQKCSVSAVPPRRSKTRAGACARTGVHACQELGCSGTPKKEGAV